MMARRQILKLAAAALALAGFLVSCKHEPAGQHDRRDQPNRDSGGGEGGY